MAWFNVTLDRATLEGRAFRVFYDASLDDFDESRITAEKIAAAKQRVKMLIASKLGSFVVKAGGVTEYLDTVSTTTDLDEFVQAMLGYAFLEQYLRDERWTDRDKFFTDMESVEMKLKESVEAFAAVAPYETGGLSQTITSPRSYGTSGVVDAWDGEY